MTVDDFLRGQNRRTFFVLGCTVGAFVGVVLAVFIYSVTPLPGTGRPANSPGGFFSVVSTWGIPATVFDPDPNYTLRVLQSVGVLLPLFTGLLRFTTNDRSEVSDRANDYLLLGIVVLVLAGVFAAVAGTLTETTIILKLSLVFVLFAFTIMGFAAVMMSEAFDDSTNSSELETSETETDDEETQREAETRPSKPENREGESNENGAENESNWKDDRCKRPNEVAENQTASSGTSGE